MDPKWKLEKSKKIGILLHSKVIADNVTGITHHSIKEKKL